MAANWAIILVGGTIFAVVLSLVLDAYWGGILLTASVVSEMTSVANLRCARRLADLRSRHGDGLITRSDYETERDQIIRPPIPNCWSAVG